MKIVCLPILMILIFLPLISCDQLKEPYKAQTLYSFQVSPQITDAAIKTSSVSHLASVNTRTLLQGKLFVFLGSTGSTPQNYLSINKLATSLGYHVINLNYLNAISEKACNESVDPACFSNYHEEVIFGGLQSDLVEVTVANSIHNRILKLLQYLHKLNANNNWSQFYEGSELVYSKIVLAGHSQGGSHAAYLAQKNSVDRVVLFSSPSDYFDAGKQPAAWCRNDFATATDKFYVLAHKRDSTLNLTRQYAIWKDMGILSETDTSSADISTYVNFRALVTDFEPNPSAKIEPLYLNLTAQDYALPSGDDRTQLKLVWRHLLGDSGR